MTFAAFIASVLLCLMAAISPGPAVLMAARVGLARGWRSGLALAIGIGTGAVVWASAALFGLNLLFDYAPFLLTLLKVGGALFLIYMAWHMWRHASEPMSEDGNNQLPQTAFAAFRLGIVTQLANPKPAAFFGAVFVGTVPEGSSAMALAALLMCIFLGEVTWNTLVARIFSFEKTRRGYINLKHVIDRIFGGLLAALGVKIAAI
ncbi:LysE family translocator [Phaeobacter porticola]|uniref:Putative threonine efflux protein n=1 Tax=Phaeobacter porticola TaxID=1844006 RepID=A0A1L3I4P6_9RHOB|nr:LysE family translocator [Phaeobacter porticola]APG47104.1 putative threonine efflux protein [Phaeobacter porticola]